jgi:cyclic beta-1,2-glucan synthetase
MGRNGSLTRPAALNRTKLSGRVGAGLDPCTALQTTIELVPDESREIVILLGQTESAEEAREIISRYQKPSAVAEAFEHVTDYWDELLSEVEIQTPDAAMNTLANRGLLYQTLSCRLWARSAFYQSSGAYGFRDQLQDCLALVYARPDLTRQQILRSASRQFREGDVQHWWQPTTGRGVRSRCSDDRLWLPYATAFYINTTGDTALLDELLHFLDAPALSPDQDEQYSQPTVSDESACLYEHCVRALGRSQTVGSHGLPLMGSGDWNDGMNRVGREGKGESVWLAWFLYATLKSFAPLCDSRDQKERAAGYRLHMERLRKALEEFGWDGNWYRRAYFDDGTPLGSVENEECRIDSLSQSWGVISGGADPRRASRAMEAVEQHLIRRGDGLVLLLTPPFDRMSNDPGYIKSYVPGVRENGGQYTHAALWLLIAYAELGDGDQAGELLALLNPINHASTRAGVHRYKVEPYVVAADLYSVPPHSGRGGWTWYTGSAALMYRALLESILGFKLCGDRFAINPCIPRSWREYQFTYRRGSARYQVRVENPHGVCSGVAAVEVDGRTQSSAEIPVSDDGKTHLIRIVLGEKAELPNERQFHSKSTSFDNTSTSIALSRGK